MIEVDVNKCTTKLQQKDLTKSLIWASAWGVISDRNGVM